MADNINVTPGAGVAVATDEVTGTGEHIQIFKIAYSADGVRTLVPADVNGLLVNLGTNNDVILSAGTNNIGDVDVLTEPALDLSTDQVGSALMTNVLMNDRTELVPAFAAIDAASSGDNTILAAQGSGNRIRVHSLFVVASSAVNVRFESGAGGTALTGQMQLAANSGFVLPFNPVGWFQTAANTLLNMELSSGVSVDGCFQYTVTT